MAKSVAELKAEIQERPKRSVAKRNRVYVRKDNEVLAAAERVFMQLGYALTTMDDVAKVADVSKRTIYSNFESKEKLFAEVIRRRCAGVLPDPKVVAKAREAEPAEGLRLLSTAFLKSVMEKPTIELYQTVADAARHQPEVGKMLFDGPIAATRKVFRDYLREQVAIGKLEIDDVDQAAGQLSGLLKADLHMLLVFSQPVSITPKKIAKHVAASIDLFLYGTAKHAR